MLIQGNPVASEALGEFIRPDLQGDFLGWPTDNDKERFNAMMAADHSVAASVPLFNIRANIAETPVLATQAYVFSPEPNNEELKTFFITAYGDHIDVVQRVCDEHEAANLDEEARQAMTEGRDRLLSNVAVTLAGEGRRLLGGYAMLATKAVPREYVGFAFGARAVLERHQFGARQAILNGGFAGLPEELRRSRLQMQSDDQLEMLAHNTIIRKMVPQASIAKSLGIKLEEIPPDTE